MNTDTNKLNTLTNNNAEANNMNNNTNELMPLPKVNMMNLFDDIAVNEEIKSPHDWTLDDCKDKLTVIFKESKKENMITVSVRLQGLTMLKVSKNKTTMDIPNGSFTKDEILKRIKSCDEMVTEAKERHIASLKKAKISRETTYKRMPKGAKPEIEEDGQDFSQPSYSE